MASVHEEIYPWFKNASSVNFFSGKIYDLLLLGSFLPLFLLFRATCVAYGGSQARGLIRAVAVGLHHSHSNASAT